MTQLIAALRSTLAALEKQEGGVWSFDIIRRNGDGAILSLRFTQKDVRPLGVEAAEHRCVTCTRPMVQSNGLWVCPLCEDGGRESCDQCGKSH